MLSKALIFTCIGCVGVIATAVSAVLESKKVCERLDDVIVDPEDMYTDECEVYEESVIEKVVQTVKDFKFTIGIAAATIASIIVSHRISAKALVLMTGSCGGIVLNRDKILETVREYTKDADHDICEDIVTEAAIKTWSPEVSVEETGFGNDLCYFAYTGRWFHSSYDVVMEQLRFFNEELTEYIDACACVADLYAILNLNLDQVSKKLGWAPGWYDEKEGVMFNVKKVDQWTDTYGRLHDTSVIVISIDYRTQPEFGFEEAGW